MHDSERTWAIGKPTQHFIDKREQQDAIALHEHAYLLL